MPHQQDLDSVFHKNTTH